MTTSQADDHRALYDGLYREGYRKGLGPLDRARLDALRHFIVRVVQPRSQSRVLDYGCGPGINVGLWNDIFAGSELYSCDISAVAIDELEHRFPGSGDRTAVIAGDRAPWPDAFFDTVVSVEVMEHVADLKAYLADIRRLLVPGGVFVWTTPSANVLSIEHVYAALTGNIEPTGEGYRRWRFEDPTHMRRLKTAEIRRILADMGFDAIRFRHRAHLFSFLCSRILPGRLARLGRWLMPLDYTFFRRLPNGASMIGMARRTSSS
ncbi:MAG: class I SAM-dependent methyltransferase [Rhodospirillales bacterium]|nr:class I SAM-dependent methyltransferase [Rhodospirillales bacterium]